MELQYSSRSPFSVVPSYSRSGRKLAVVCPGLALKQRYAWGEERVFKSIIFTVQELLVLNNKKTHFLVFLICSLYVS